MVMSVHLSVCLSGPNFSRAVNLHLSSSENNQAVREHSENTKRALREQLVSTQ